MELHYGEILIRSREGEGTEVIIRLPLGKDHLKEAEIVEVRDLQDFENVKGPALDETVEPPARPSGETKASPGFSEKTVVLVVEDNVDVRNYIRQQLEPAYEVAEAQNGSEGVDIAFNVIPDLIICDVMMPKMDGYELCRKLKQDVKTSHIPIILLTAKAEEQDKLEGLETGADDYLVKPFNSQKLLASDLAPHKHGMIRKT